MFSPLRAMVYYLPHPPPPIFFFFLGAKIALGEELPLHVIAYPVDSADGAPEEAFSQDQVALMNVTFQNDQSLAFVSVHRTESNRSSGANTANAGSSSPSSSSSTMSSSSSALSILDLLDFTVRGLVVGRHRITATVTNRNLDPKYPGRFLSSTVLSAALILHVFPPLVVLPRRLVLLPGAYFDLKIQGGAGGSSQNVFRVTNDSLAYVGQHGMVVTGRANEGMLGDAVVTVHAEGTSHRTQKTVVYARDAIPIRVALLTDIAIAAPSRKMLVGNMMKLQVRGKSFETPFMFGSSNITFDWRSENGDVLAIEHHRRFLSQSSNEMNDDDYYASFSDHDSSNFAVWVNAKAVGDSVVHVTVVSNPKGFPVQTFTHSIPFTVVAPLRLVSPPSLLLWPGATATLRTNADVNQKLHYTQANSKWADITSASSASVDGDDTAKRGQAKTSPPSLVSFEGHGVIRAGNVQGRTTVTIFNEAEEQAVTVAIEVKDVAQMTLVGDTTMYVGEEKQMHVRLTDDLGRPFDLDDSALAVSALFNNQSVFSLTSSGSSGAVSDSEHRQNHSFTARANYEGETIVKFWRDGTSPSQISVDLATAQTLAAMQSALVPKVFSKGTAEVLEASTRIADYVSLRAIHRIYPQGSQPPSSSPSASVRLLLHVGAECNFTSEASAHEWWSDDRNILSVNSATGRAHAGTDSGTTFVNHRGLLTNRARIVISRVAKMTLDSSNPADSSDASSLVVVPGREFEFPITVYGKDGAELADKIENASLKQNVRITCHIDEQAMSHAMGLGGRALGRWGLVKAYGRRDPQSGRHFCVVNITEPQEADRTSAQGEFPRVDVLSFSARASDSQGTYSFAESFPNRIPYVPKMRVRVTYPHEPVPSAAAAAAALSASASAYASGNFPAPGDAGGKPLLGCVELQPSKGGVSAFVDVYGKSPRHSRGGAGSDGSARAGSGENEKPLVDAHEDVSAVLVEREQQQDGWTRYRYLVTPNMKALPGSGAGAFEQRVITFTQPSMGTTKDICVSYGQRHEHRWYCAVTDASSPMPGVFRRSACGQCPQLPADTPSNTIDTRYREMRCCAPDAGIECVAPNEVTSTYRCNAADRPDKDCAIFNRAADGSGGSGKTRRRYEDMSDNEIVENSLPMMVMLAVLGVGTATYLFGDNFFAAAKDTVRILLCPANHRDPRRMAARAAMPGAPAPAFGNRAADLHQDRPRGHRDVFYRRNAPTVVGASRTGVGAGGYGAGVRAQAYDPVEEFIDR